MNRRGIIRAKNKFALNSGAGVACALTKSKIEFELRQYTKKAAAQVLIPRLNKGVTCAAATYYLKPNSFNASLITFSISALTCLLSIVIK